MSDGASEITADRYMITSQRFAANVSSLPPANTLGALDTLSNELSTQVPLSLDLYPHPLQDGLKTGKR